LTGDAEAEGAEGTEEEPGFERTEGGTGEGAEVPAANDERDGVEKK